MADPNETSDAERINNALASLVEAQRHLQTLPKLAALRTALQSVQIDLSASYILHHAIDQEDDIFVILTKGQLLHAVEVFSDANSPPRVSDMSVESYRSGLGQDSQLRLEIALGLTL